MENYKSEHHHKDWDISIFSGKSEVYKGVLKMAELKGIIFLFNTLGWTAFTYGLFVSFFNVDVFTRTVMSFLGIVFITIKIISYAFSSRRKHELETLEIKKMKNEEKQRELDIREREIAIYERENKIIRDFEN